MTNDKLLAHLATGLTTTCRCWLILRRDGVRLGFTDHDRDIAFGGYTFRADTGMTARRLARSTGLAVDETEAMGVLSSSAVTEADIEAGRYDGAEIRAWLVNWQHPETQHALRFRGHLGEITRGDGAFHAELRGLTDALNQPVGRSYQPRCSAILGDGACRADIDRAGFREWVTVTAVEGGRVFRFADPVAHPAGWFARGRVTVTGGAAKPLAGVVREDRVEGGERILTLWEPIRAEVVPGDQLRIEAGCDKTPETCREKFGNFLNFRGFPHVPGEGWLTAVPRAGDAGENGGFGA